MENSVYNPFSLDGKTILVTGASSGIGRAIAIECSRIGAKVILSARNVQRLEETLHSMEGDGHSIIPVDLVKEDEIRALAKNIPPIDGLASVAGRADMILPLKFYSSKSVEDVFRLNVFSSMYLVRDLLKYKKINDKASLVFMSSVASGIIPSKGNGIYCTSKAALDAFSRQCALELGHRQIRSNTINPTMVDTPMAIHPWTGADSDVSRMFAAGVRSFEERLQVLNRLGKPEDVALMAIYLLSDASSFVTGTSMLIDGGAHVNFVREAFDRDSGFKIVQ